MKYKVVICMAVAFVLGWIAHLVIYRTVLGANDWNYVANFSVQSYLRAHQFPYHEAIFSETGMLSIKSSGMPISDLGCLSGMPIEELVLNATAVDDLVPLSMVPSLRRLSIIDTRVSDISCLKGHRLEKFVASQTSISDLSPLYGMPLEDVRIHNTLVTNISPVVSPYLKTLVITQTCIEDLSPLTNAVALREISFDLEKFGLKSKQIQFLRRLDSLTIINLQDAKKFWAPHAETN